MKNTITPKRGQAAYLEFFRINAEDGVSVPEWDDLPLTTRMAWETAAQSVSAMVTVEEAKANEYSAKMSARFAKR